MDFRNQLLLLLYKNKIIHSKSRVRYNDLFELLEELDCGEVFEMDKLELIFIEYEKEGMYLSLTEKGIREGRKIFNL